MSENNNLVSAIEAVLFASGDAVKISDISKALGIDNQVTELLVDKLNKRYSDCGSSLTVSKLSDSFQISTRPEYGDFIKRVFESDKNAPLSNAAMEVLTIIAYNQPVSKSFVSNVRGVESGGLVNSLLEKELLEEAGRLDVPGKPVAYRTSLNFLRCFGLSSIDELEPVPDTKNISTNNENN